MPYDNVPRSLWGKMDRCVEAVMKEGKDKEAAIAICYQSVVEAPRRLLAVLRDAERIEAQALTEAQTYTPRHEAIAAALQHQGLVEAGARHTQREFQIIEEVIKLMTELYGEIEDLGAFIEKVTSVTEAIGEATVVDHLISVIHRAFTVEADDLVGSLARLNQDERIFLSHAIGAALDAFNAVIDAERPELRLRTLYQPYEPTPNTVVNVVAPTDVEVSQPDMLNALGLSGVDTSDPEPEDAFELMASQRQISEGTPPATEAAPPVTEAVQSATEAAQPVSEAPGPANDRTTIERAIVETVNGAFSIDDQQRHPDGSFILGGRVIVEGRSDNGNRYTLEALRSGPAAFAGQYIFIDHPSLSEVQDRPERSEYDKVGLLPKNPDDFYIATVQEGESAGKQALFFKNGKLSQTVDWLATRIKEGISGEMSVNAHGRGIESEDGSEFIVEAFVLTPLTSLDFVTKGAAGGRGLLEAPRALTLGGEPDTTINSLTLEQLVERRPDLLAALTAQTREQTLQEANAMTVKLTEAQKQIVGLKAALRKHRQQARKEKADKVVGEALAGSGLPTEGQTRVRSLLEAQVKRFVEAEGDPAGEPPGELAPAGSGMNPGDPAAIELPPDVAALPEEAQALWLEAYVGALPKGEKRATNLAWAGVYGAGWVEGDTGWYKEQPEAPAVDTSGVPATGTENPVVASAKPATLDALKTAVAEAIKDEKTYLGKVTNAGAIADLGAGDATIEEATKSEAALEEAFAHLLPKAQVKVAAAGREPRRLL